MIMFHQPSHFTVLVHRRDNGLAQALLGNPSIIFSLHLHGNLEFFHHESGIHNLVKNVWNTYYLTVNKERLPLGPLSTMGHETTNRWMLQYQCLWHPTPINPSSPFNSLCTPLWQSFFNCCTSIWSTQIHQKWLPT